MCYRVAVLFLLVFLAGCRLSAPPGENGRAAQAWAAAAKFVIGRATYGTLRLPERTDSAVRIEQLSPDRYNINAWSEGSNEKGEAVRQKWHCIAVFDGDGNWRITDYTVYAPSDVGGFIKYKGEEFKVKIP